MIVGIGVDIIQIKRIERWLENAKLLERYFHPDEVVYSKSRGGGAALSLAARFAAKEAFGKALGTGLANIVLKDIMIYNNSNSKPEIMLYGTALAAMEESGANKAHISLSHEIENAIAMVVLERV